SIYDLFERWAHNQPDHPAISLGSRTFSYRQLEDAALHVALLLQQKQVLPGDFVPVLATRSIEMVVCFFGILKAGACYVPIDAEAWGKERIASTLEAVSARVVIDLGAPAGASSYLSGYDVVSMPDVQAAAFEPASDGQWTTMLDRYWPEIKPSDLAYMIFTSGTTSAPKGVMIPHSAILNYAQQGDDETPFNFNANQNDKVLLLFSPGFDACVAVLVSALCNGAQVMMTSSSSDLLECAAKSTILVATPSVLSVLGDPGNTFDKARTIILGGEAPSQSLLEKWWTPTRNIYNAYGLTETTIMSLIGRAVPWEPVTLGHTMQGSRVVLLPGGDVSSGAGTGTGEDDCDFGEMCITGPGLAVGFYRNESLTAEKFITLQSGERAYRTGDFARRTSHGLEFAGRIDSMVKNRGFLINLESQVVPALLAQGASEAAAFIHEKQLIGFVAPESLDTGVLRQALARKHEDFLVPDRIRALKALPLTVNGKTDVKALRRMLEEEESNRKSNSHPGPLALASVDHLDDGCSFWELGGNSLAAIRVLSYLRKRGLTIELKALFDLPDLHSVCNAMREMGFKDPNEKREHEALVPMTSLQSKMVQASIKTPGLNYMLLHIRIPFYPATTDDLNRIKVAWTQALGRHPAFRTSFLLKDGLQEIRPQVDLDWSHEETTPDRADSVIRAQSDDLGRRLMASDESSGDVYVPMNAFRLITVPGQASILLMAVHHARVDGWSLSIVVNEARAAFQHGSQVDLAPSEASMSFRHDQFTRVAFAQKQLQSDPAGAKFWAELLLEDGTAFPELGLPKAQQLPTMPLSTALSPAGGPVSIWMNNHTLSLDVGTGHLESAARRLRVVPSALLYAAWALVLSNNTLSDRVAFGAVLSGRNLVAKAVSGIVGPLINTIPFPVQIGNEQQTISAFASSIHSQLMTAVEFQWSAAEAMAAMRSESINGIMHTVIGTEYDVPPLQGDWSIEHQELMVEFDLSLMVEKEGPDGLQVRALFDAARYAAAGVSRVLLHFRNALKGLMDSSHVHVQDARKGLLEGSELAALIRPPTDKTQHSGPRTVKDALEGAAASWPGVCAVESTQDGSMSYQELHEASNKLARAIKSHMNGRAPRDVVVCVLTDRTLHWIVAIVAVIKAGCVCCPLDVTLPQKRIETIIQQSGASIFVSANRDCMLTIEFRKDDTPHESRVCIVVDEFLQGAQDAAPVETVTQTADVIYLVFTSGTTGVPKGVPLHNLSILNVIANPGVRLFAGPGRRIAQVFSAGFDIATLEIFGTLCYGGTLVLKERTDPFEHLKRVHAAIMTPSILSACLPSEHPLLDTIVVGGEPVPQSMAEIWGSGRTLINGYGPSECGSISTTSRLLPGHKVTIGHELPQVSVYVLDHRQCPVAQGVTGEICVSGEQVTRGYWGVNHGQNNKERHVPNPFASSPAQQLMYRTGDLGYWDDEMNLNYVGRIDNQVKVRGFRVELEEIEHAISTAADLDPKVQSAVVVVVDNGPKGQSEEGKRLVGFVTPQNVDLAALRSKIAAVLPGHMRPSQMMGLLELPTTSNYKADRRKLADLAMQNGGGKNGETVLTATERVISEVWKELLHLDPNAPMQKDQDFLAMGGNSILAIKAARKLASSTGRHIPVALLLRATVLEELARVIDQYETPSLAAKPETQSFSAYISSQHEKNVQNGTTSNPTPLSYMEEELFYSHAESDTRSAFHTVIQFTLTGAINTKALAESFKAVQRENPIMRARYAVDAQGHPCRFTTEHVASAQCVDGDQWDDEKTQALADAPFDLTRDQLVRMVIWDRSNDSVGRDGAVKAIEITLITHHIITDRASLLLVLQSMSRHYRDTIAAAQSMPTNIQQSSKIDYGAWARWLQTHQQEAQTQTQVNKKLAFWKETLSSLKHIHMLPRDPLSGPNGGQPKQMKEANLGSSRHICIQPPAEAPDAYSQRLAVAATALALRAVFAPSSGIITLAIPYMNRDDPATADMLGLFVDRLPVRLALKQEDLVTAAGLLDAVRSATHHALEHRVPYAQIRSQFAVPPSEDAHDHRFIDVLVIYNWRSDALETALNLGPEVRVAQLSGARAARPRGAMFPLSFDYSEQEDGGLEVHVEYNPGLVPAAAVDAL
ncbi:hypothetical protein ACRALDRAFT_1007025, partial [Sodiomyces alcalophilus JCM 7366]|uniref:uncharacterized protein n=1 Tax=Sodiomyces alcalophilus JCM 7366 TaxID=591952 RepID=UPI0039B4CC88